MKVKQSEYLKEIKPVLIRLRDRLLTEFPYASLLAQDSTSKNYSVSKTNVGIQMDQTLTGRGFVAKVYDGKSYAEYSFNQISEELIDDIVSAVKERLLPMSFLEHNEIDGKISLDFLPSRCHNHQTPACPQNILLHIAVL